jgi:DNA-binding FrmR family transcriptional regulator
MRLHTPRGMQYTVPMEHTTHIKLTAHLARIEGQLSAVRTALDQDDCSKAARTLLAASRSLQSARALCVAGFLSERVYPHAKVADPALLEDVKALLKA